MTKICDSILSVHYKRFWQGRIKHYIISEIHFFFLFKQKVKIYPGDLDQREHKEKEASSLDISSIHYKSHYLAGKSSFISFSLSFSNNFFSKLKSSSKIFW